MDDTQTGNWYGEAAATFGDRVAGAREAARLSQSDLARNLGVKLKTIQGWEDDRNEPRANKLQMLSGMLNVSMRWLLTGEGEGIEAPESSVAVSSDVSAVLIDLARMRAQSLALAKDMGQLEKRLRSLLRESAA